MTGTAFQGQRIGVIGSGISGLSAAWLLCDRADVTMLEHENSIGGHSHAVSVDAGAEHPTQVDMGFIVYNETTYPNLTALFDHLGVATNTTDMSLAVSLDQGRLEYAGGHLSQLFAQRSNLIRPRFWSMIRDLVRFYRDAPKDLADLVANNQTLGAYLEANRYGLAFRDDHLLPMAAAIWSMPTASVLEYPAHAFIRFQENHGLLKLTGRPLWRTVVGGSRSYVERLSAPISDNIEVAEGAVSVERQMDGVFVHTTKGRRLQFDQVVIATHADQALRLLSSPTSKETALLGAFQYNSNDVLLHEDQRLMPRRRRAWASWNYIGESRPDQSDQLTVTYWMNSLQSLPAARPLFVTLNPNRDVQPDSIHARRCFEHPIINTAATKAQQWLWSLQGEGGIWYCGAYFGAGFHEDGLQAGLAVGEAISGCKRPWRVENESGRIFVKQSNQAVVQQGFAA